MKHIIDGSIWVNKKSGTTHMTFFDTTHSGTASLHTVTLNLRWEKDYYFRGDAIERFKNNYEMVANNPSESFFSNVLANKQLKNKYKYGQITKKDFFSMLKGGQS